MYSENMMPPFATLSNLRNKVEITRLPSTLGRSEDLADLYLNHNSVSRTHCVFECINGKVTVRDIGSTAGTFINGVQLETNVPYNLEEGCKVTIGKVRLVFHVNYDGLMRYEQEEFIKRQAAEADKRAERENRKKEITIDAKELSMYEYDESEVVYIDCGLEPEKKRVSYTSELRKNELEKARRKEETHTAPVYAASEIKRDEETEATAEIPDAAPGKAKRVLMLTWIDDETGDSKRLRIEHFPFSIGRKSDENDYAVRRKGMSRRHMHFEESDGSIYLIDDNSTNGVRLNGSKVENGNKCELRDGDSIRVADITFSVRITG